MNNKNDGFKKKIRFAVSIHAWTRQHWNGHDTDTCQILKNTHDTCVRHALRTHFRHDTSPCKNVRATYVLIIQGEKKFKSSKHLNILFLSTTTLEKIIRQHYIM